jgi:hypothetical protein
MSGVTFLETHDRLGTWDKPDNVAMAQRVVERILAELAAQDRLRDPE